MNWRKQVRQFVSFVAVSGVGWLLDLLSFGALIWLGQTPGFANFCSSFVGVSFVWVVATRAVFQSKAAGWPHLLCYWAYQCLSILAYSWALKLLLSQTNLLATLAELLQSTVQVKLPHSLLGKILITAPNLLSNFLFMKLFLSYIDRRASDHQYKQ